MKRLHVNLRSEHHLKHQARQQYGLFLKGAGLSLEEALVFWKSEFTKKMDSDKVKISKNYNNDLILIMNVFIFFNLV